ncbi:MAG: glycoside hydrolase family 13 protein [Chloroflexota bacterium]|nr:glycoside hydrolase family 13 protein [Chloroflexota bacterium]PLS79256.1 MAG: alpha-amylase [Chloroflexota bacterium]
MPLLYEVVTPEWVKHAVFYQIFPDRFAISSSLQKPHNLEPWDTTPTTYGYKGGDLLGVLERLDYIQGLGVTAVYFNPIFQSASNHRYHTHDYYQVDPLLGGNAAFDTLLAECKRRGLRVVLDGVFNHASRGFFQFNDILENGAASPWLDWFYVDDAGGVHPINAYDLQRAPGYKAWWGLHALPKLNTDNPQVREYLMQVGEHWIRKGIDGWRLDVANEITTPGFWQEFRQRIKALNPDAYIVAEIWEESPQWLQGDQFDAVMNYPLTEALISFVAGKRLRREFVENKGYRPVAGITGQQFAAKVDRLLQLYPWPIVLAQLNLLDSHDTARFISIADGDETSLRLATLLLFTLPGAPSIYYGDEIGMTGGGSDALARKTFPWNQPEAWNHELRDFHKQVIALRKTHPALRVGTFQNLYADTFGFAFARTLADQTFVIAVNVGHESATQRLPLTRLINTDTAPRVVFGAASRVQTDNSTITLDLPARSATVLNVSQR